MSTPAPLILSTWSFGQRANAVAWEVLAAGGSALDAVERAAIAIEADPNVDSVGLGGLPDSAGRVSLDACIMLSPRQCGGVCAVRHHNYPASIARRVMERTNHLLLAGQGADDFAAAQGFEAVELLTDEARRVWEMWKSDPNRLTDERYRGWLPPRNVEELRGVSDDRQRLADETLPHNRHHDTIGVLAIDAHRVMAGACTTSGMAFKMPGRVGDSPIIGHGLYVDPKAGAAVATGTGELVMRTCTSFLAVEWMRCGKSPAQAAVAAIDRIVESCDIVPDHQVGLITLNPDGDWSSAALRPGFRVAVRSGDRDELIPAEQVRLEGTTTSDSLL